MARSIEPITKAEMAYHEIRNMIAEDRSKAGEVIVHRIVAEGLAINNAPGGQTKIK